MARTRMWRRALLSGIVGGALLAGSAYGEPAAAQVSLPLPKVVVPEVKVPLPGGTPEIRTPPVKVPVLDTEVPSIQVPSVPLPKVEVPSTEIGPVEVRGIEVGSGGGGSTLDAVSGRVSETLGSLTGSGRRSAPRAVGETATGSTGSTPVSAGAARASTGLSPGSALGGQAVAPTAGQLVAAGLPQSRPSQIARWSRDLRLFAARELVWGIDRPLSGRRLRALRRTLADAAGCLPLLPERGRRALELRAGTGPLGPTSTRAIARRLGLTVPAAIRLQRSSLRFLVRADAGGRCDAAPRSPAVGVESGAPGGSAPRVARAQPGSVRPGPAIARVSERTEVRGVSATSPPGRLLESLDSGGATRTATTLLAFLGVVAALLLGVAMASRTRANPTATRAPHDRRPLLFLDVDGVLVLSPYLPVDPPAGSIYHLLMGAVYVPDRVADLLRRLEQRFELVWASGWERHANAELRRVLGLREDLPALTFGGKARIGTADWKTKQVERYAAGRPLAWLDDNFDPSHDAWAEKRKAPTLLVPVYHAEGLSEAHVETLLEWAAALEREPVGVW